MPTEATPPAARTGCPHHWRIQTPNGPSVHATCLRCGLERDFRTASESQWMTGAERGPAA